MEKPFAWYGGKSRLVPTLLSLLPQHTTYVEVFGGSGALLFAKEPSALEIFNDLDSGVVNFFRVLRNPEQAEQLRYRLSLTPYAREEYYECLHHWHEATDPVERARQWYSAVMQSMNCSIRATGWSSTKMPGSNPARAWHNSVGRLTTFVERLSYVQIDHRDYEQVITAYDSPQTCFYLDPPYLAQARRKVQCYRHEMSVADHERLLACIRRVKGMVFLSGYASSLYRETLADWECLTVAQVCSSAYTKKDTSAEDTRRIECIWRNLACVHHAAGKETQLPLFV